LNVTASLVESVIADPARRRAARERDRARDRAAATAASRGHAAGGSSRGHAGAGPAARDHAAGRSPRDHTAATTSHGHADEPHAGGATGPSRRGAASSPGGGAGPSGGGADWESPPPDESFAPRYDDPGPETGSHTRNGAHRLLDRREQTERAYLAYCLALPDEGERRLAEADLDELFDSPMTRRAAEYLRGRVRTPAADLPPGDEPLARLVAELVIRAGQLEATPAKLELEALQLDLSRLDRLIAGARASGGEGMQDLASKRQTVLDQIRHRLT
jgi:hypothetical protein